MGILISYPPRIRPRTSLTYIKLHFIIFKLETLKQTLDYIFKLKLRDQFVTLIS
jgi:hypothetical protein